MDVEEQFRELFREALTESGMSRVLPQGRCVAEASEPGAVRAGGYDVGDVVVLGACAREAMGGSGDPDGGKAGRVSDKASERVN
jgi:hypothetical protein